jgi:hypothetical protein
MKSYVFSGRVMPERTNVYLAPITLNNGVVGREMTKAPQITVSISYSIISVTVGEVDAIVDLQTLKNSIANIVSALVDVIGYQNGCGYEIEIDQAIDELGIQTIFGVRCIHDSPEDARKLQFEVLRDIPLQNVFLRKALEDIRKAMRCPNDTAFHCFRVCEDIRQYFVEKFSIKKEDKNDSWKKMRNQLNIGDEWLRPLVAASKSLRHGEVIARIDTVQREEYFRISIRVIDRFYSYLLQNSEPLDKGVFPEL